MADDSDDLLDAMTDALELAGYSVLRAHNGKEAMDLAAGAPVGLILMDLSMPVMDGWEFLRRRRSIPQLASVPVVIMSAYASPQPAGADCILQKPVTLDTILALAKRYTRHA
ncbi:MAG TPA: response regulator [Candidatus Binataceae bacterium]|nr:response regulator [Candidatus Binataceae bacterium]